jgi:hypothetical protein
MTRGGGTSGRVALGIAAALLALPSIAAAQSAVDEYTLDIPGGGGGSPSGNSGGPPAADTAGSGSASGSGGGHSGQDTRGSGAAADTAGGRARGDAGASAERAGAAGAPFQDGTARTTDADDRTAPEVVADTFLDGAMLPLLGALVVITGIGAWRLLRHRHTPTGAAG